MMERMLLASTLLLVLAVCSSYATECESGFQELPGSRSCQNIDECLGDNNCHEYADCTDTYGSYNCTCKDGFTGNGTRCKDEDECASSICHVNATCNNTIGSYTCTCNEGYRGNGTNCVLDVCPASLNCDPHNQEVCEKVESTWKCVCKPGFEKTPDSRSCSDFPECTHGNNDCHRFADCAETFGSYKCTCGSGYTGNGTFCEDVNECFNVTCHVNATCNNTIGSYKCICKDGFVGNGVTCEKDVCPKDKCLQEENCVKIGSNWECVCKAGFYKPKGSRTCTDIQECRGDNNCHKDADCTETYGSYKCKCKDGYSGNGTFCEGKTGLRGKEPPILKTWEVIVAIIIAVVVVVTVVYVAVCCYKRKHGDQNEPIYTDVQARVHVANNRVQFNVDGRHDGNNAHFENPHVIEPPPIYEEIEVPRRNGGEWQSTNDMFNNPSYSNRY